MTKAGISFIAFTVLMAVIFPTSCRQKPKETSEKPVPVSVFTAKLQEISTVVDIAGRVEPQNRVTVYSQVAGKVKSVVLSEGDRVARNGLLAEVIQDIPGSDYLPHPVRSPIAGTVLSVAASQGASVNPQTPLFEIGDTRCINFVGEVYGEDRDRVRPGQKLLVTGQGGDTLLGMSVGKLAPQLDPVTGGQRIEATVCLLKNPLLIGQQVDGHVEVGRLTGILVPRVSLVRDSLGRDGVYEVSDDSAVFRQVRVLNRSQEHFLIEGLPEGAQVVAEGASGLRPGRRISVVGGRQ